MVHGEVQLRQRAKLSNLVIWMSAIRENKGNVRSIEVSIRGSSRAMH